MKDSSNLNLNKSDLLVSTDQQDGQSLKKGLYIKDDDQDWGSAGMNDVQNDPE